MHLIIFSPKWTRKRIKLYFVLRLHFPLWVCLTSHHTSSTHSWQCQLDTLQMQLQIILYSYIFQYAPMEQRGNGIHTYLSIFDYFGKWKKRKEIPGNINSNSAQVTSVCLFVCVETVVISHRNRCGNVERVVKWKHFSEKSHSFVEVNVIN